MSYEYQYLGGSEFKSFGGHMDDEFYKRQEAQDKYNVFVNGVSKGASHHSAGSAFPSSGANKDVNKVRLYAQVKTSSNELNKSNVYVYIQPNRDVRSEIASQFEVSNVKFAIIPGDR